MNGCRFVGCWATVFLALFSSASCVWAGFTTAVWPRDVEHAAGEVKIISSDDDAANISNVLDIPSDIQSQVLDGGIVGNNKTGNQWRAALVLLKDGTVRGWGGNQSKVLNIPPDLTDVVQITATHGFGAALRSTGDIVVWGFYTSFRSEIEGTFTQISAGARHLIGITQNGEVKAFGQNNQGQGEVPAGLGKVKWIDVWGNTNFAIDADDKLHAWGHLEAEYFPLPDDLPPARVFAHKNGMGLIITTEGKVFTWGEEKQSRVAKGWIGKSAKTAFSGEYSLACLSPEGSWEHSHPASTVPKLLGARSARSRHPFMLAVYPTETIPAPKPVVAAAEPKPMPGPKPTSVQPPDLAAVKKLVDEFSVKLNQNAGKPYLDAVSKLNAQYIGVIGNLEKSATREGNLDAVQAVLAEKKLLAGEGIPESNAAGTIEQIAQLRTKYRAQVKSFAANRDLAATEVVGEFDAALQGIEVKLTKGKDIETALKVREFRNQLQDWLEAEFGFRSAN